MKSLVPLLVLGTLFFVAGCDRTPTEGVVLPRTPVVSIRSGYALVLPQYVRVYPNPNDTGAIVYHLRQGDIIEVVEESGTQDWSKIRTAETTGWVKTTHIRFFDSWEQASNARQTYLDGLD